MNVKSLAVISAGVVLIMAGVAVGGYYAGNKAGYERANKEYAVNVADVVEKARIEQEKRNAEHLQRVAEYHEAQKDSDKAHTALQERLREIQAKRPDEVNDGICHRSDRPSNDIIELLNSAIRNTTLPEATEKPLGS